jgi:hypothetical protein
MTKIFYDLEEVIIYIDNIILFTKTTFHHHLQRLALVLERIQSQNLHVHVEETFLATNKVDYLGYTITSKGIKPQKQRIMSILALAEPENKRQLRSFFVIVNFYCQLWYHQSHIITPLAAITSDKAKWVWVTEQKKAFKEICNTIAHQVLLTYPDFSKPFDIFTDASDYQLGAVIAQEPWPIAFYSRKLNPAQRNCKTMEKELLSIVETAQNYIHIILGGQCTFHCDQNNLGFQNFKSERVRRWRATLEEFQYSFVYCPGKDNCIADMLSRYPITSADTSTYEEVTTLQDSSFPATFERITQS